MKNKKALSPVVAMLLLIALAVAVTAIVLNVVKKNVEEQVEQSESCYGIYDKVAINSEYTCYDSDSEKIYFGLNIGDIEVDSLLISISFEEGTSKIFTLTKDEQSITDLTNYPSGTGNVKVPDKKSGATYIASGITTQPDSIKIAPKVNDKQCETSDTLYDIPSCEVTLIET